MKLVSLRKSLAAVLALIGACAVSFVVDAQNLLTEPEALDLLKRRLEQEPLYGSMVTLECLDFRLARQGRNIFDYVVQPKAEPQCAEARSVLRVTDEFRVLRASGKIQWWDNRESEYAEYERAKEFRKR